MKNLKLMLLISILLMDVLSGMEFDLFVPSFPELQAQFSLTPFWVETLISLNFIGYCLSIFLVGGLADRYGRKPIIVLGLVIFVAASLLCLFAGGYPALALGRFFQGVGIAAPSILSFLIVADMYPLKEQQFLYAMLNGSRNIACALAPVVGSYLTLAFHWHGNFIALCLLGFFTLMVTLIFVPGHPTPKGVGAVQAGRYLPIFQSSTLMLYISEIVVNCAPYWIFVGISPLLYMNELSVSLHHFGLYQGSLAFTFALGSVVYGLMIKNISYSQRQMLVVGVKLQLISIFTLLFALFFYTSDPLVITLSFIPFIIAQIIPGTILYPLSLHAIPESKGRVAAVISAGNYIVSAIGLQIAGYFYEGSFFSLGSILITFIVGAAVLLCLVIRRV
ncbi:MAG TPA: MFS transporter [Gammaproteobacteria bacterium]|nr:MFS transporter [Gammaproteobacteria bacterium]